jgi:quinol-cytochrome oxidoreductase complex cytochrome b subunit
VLGINGELIAIGVITIGALAMMFLPFLDKNTERSRRIVTWAAVFALAFMVAMTLIALFGGS